MNREQLKTVLELFRTNVLTEDQTIDIIMGNNSYKGRPRGDADTSDPVKALIVKQLDLKGLNMKEVSLGIGRNETYLHQFITMGLTCPCVFPPDGVRVRPEEGRTDEASKVHGRADYRGVEGA
jgi:hypothetical protein